MTESNPVELLRDRQGVYGIGISDAYDIEALAWACGAGPRDTYRPPHVSNLILRPDMLQSGKDCQYRPDAVLQKITGGFRHGMFTHSHEEKLRQIIHHEALIRAGLPWPPPDEAGIKYWSRDKKQQDATGKSTTAYGWHHCTSSISSLTEYCGRPLIKTR